MSETADYTLTLFNTNNTSSMSTTNTVWIDGTHYCGSWCSHNHWYYNWWGYPQKETIYKYQVKCPKCKKENWIELETITPCTKCASTLKAVSKTVDYEIEVE